jgi:hypothetical protein
VDAVQIGHLPLEDRLRHDRYTVWEPALKEALGQGKDVEPVLVRCLQGADGFKTVLIAAALGDLRGHGPGDQALRELALLSGPKTADIRCASVLALAKRLGGEATPDLLVGLSSSTSAVKEYALTCLAAVGDGQGWDEVFDWLAKRLRQTSKVRYGRTSPTVHAIDYLVRHLGDDGGRKVRLVELLRKRFDQTSVDDEGWIRETWPELMSNDKAATVPLPGTSRLLDWSRNPLFSARATT